MSGINISHLTADISVNDANIHSYEIDILLLQDAKRKMKEKLTNNVIDDLFDRVIAFINKELRTAHDKIQTD